MDSFKLSNGIDESDNNKSYGNNTLPTTLTTPIYFQENISTNHSTPKEIDSGLNPDPNHLYMDKHSIDHHHHHHHQISSNNNNINSRPTLTSSSSNRTRSWALGRKIREKKEKH